MKRPKPWPSRPDLTGAQRRDLAASASYKGSGEHKAQRWWDGLPAAKQLPGGQIGRRGKQQTTVCPLATALERDRATDWVRKAIAAGQYRFSRSDKRFPKKIWFEADSQIWFGLCLNSEAGQYKGWPIGEQERDAIFR